MAELQPLKPRTPVANLKHSSHDDEDGDVKGSEVWKLSPGSMIVQFDTPPAERSSLRVGELKIFFRLALIFRLDQV